MAGGHAKTADPMNVEPALRAVRRPRLELALEVSLHVQELQAQHLHVDDERIGPAVPDVDGLVDEVVGLRCLLGDDVDGVLEDVALSVEGEGVLGLGSVRIRREELKLGRLVLRRPHDCPPSPVLVCDDQKATRQVGSLCCRGGQHWTPTASAVRRTHLAQRGGTASDARGGGQPWPSAGSS